jgi:hypothetical protein
MKSRKENRVLTGWLNSYYHFSPRALGEEVTHEKSVYGISIRPKGNSFYSMMPF